MEDLFYVELGKQIKKARLERKLSQQELANRLGIPRSNVANWEQARRMPNIKDIYQLCGVLLIDADDLLKEPKKYLYK